MNLKYLQDSFTKNKVKFNLYIDNIKRNSPKDIFTIINPTIIKNPYISVFPILFFKQELPEYNRLLLIVKNFIIFYARNGYCFLSYFVALCIFKIYGKKCDKNKISNIIDTFGLVDRVNKSCKFEEGYLVGIYDIFDAFHTEYSILIRPYGITKNPFKIKKFLKVLSRDDKNFLFEYEFIKIKDIIEILYFLFVYPFKVLRLAQKEVELQDKIFNYALLSDISKFEFSSLTRYILGKRLAEMKNISKIYSWSEFQAVERGFNYGIRSKNNNMKIYALQFFVTYESYLNVIVDDIDEDMLACANEIYVNGKYYMQNRKKVKYSLGVSLRYKNIFSFDGIKYDKNIIFFGSHIIKESIEILEYAKKIKDIVIFKNHPAMPVDINSNKFGNIVLSSENIYKLFEYAKIVVCSASGTALEAVCCGVSVIVVASSTNLTANPLVDIGKGQIWDIVYDFSEFEIVYTKLLNYRRDNCEVVKKLSEWYKDNFFVNINDNNLMRVFKFNEKDT